MVISMDRWMDLSAPSERASERKPAAAAPPSLARYASNTAGVRRAVGVADGPSSHGYFRIMLFIDLEGIRFCRALAMPPAYPKWAPND